MQTTTPSPRRWARGAALVTALAAGGLGGAALAEAPSPYPFDCPDQVVATEWWDYAEDEVGDTRSAADVAAEHVAIRYPAALSASVRALDVESAYMRASDPEASAAVRLILESAAGPFGEMVLDRHGDSYVVSAVRRCIVDGARLPTQPLTEPEVAQLMEVRP